MSSDASPRRGGYGRLGKATDPVRTRAPEAASDAEAAELDQAALGTRSFRLQQVYGAPAGWTGQKVASKGLFDPVWRRGTRERHLDEGALDALPELI